MDEAIKLSATYFDDKKTSKLLILVSDGEDHSEGAEAAAEELVELADQETGLGRPRLPGELARACNGARMFAKMLREGSWVDAKIDTAIPDRKPAPKPDIRLMHRPIGPVAWASARIRHADRT